MRLGSRDWRRPYGRALVVAGLAFLPWAASRPAAESAMWPIGRFEYRVSGKIRPLVLFWIERENVGRASITWICNADGWDGVELLVGSDPARAMGVNRWGYYREERRGGHARIFVPD